MPAAGAVVVGIETDRGPWVAALVAAGYQVFAINPMSVARYRERHSTSGAKSDPGDAHVLAEIVRLDRDHHRPVAGDSAQVEGLKMVARARQTLVWNRTRHLQRLRAALREYFPGALDALAAGKLELADPDALELLERALDPDRAARLSRSKIVGILRRARRRDVEARAEQIQSVLRAPALRQPPCWSRPMPPSRARRSGCWPGSSPSSRPWRRCWARGFDRHPDAEIYTSQPGLGVVLGAGCSPSSETTHAASATRGPARTTPAPHRSPAPPGAGPWCWPATPATNASATPSTSGALRPEELTLCPRLLRRAARSQDRPSRRAAPTRQPPRRDPARLPQDQNSLRRDHRLAPPQHRRRLTPTRHGLSEPSGGADFTAPPEGQSNVRGLSSEFVTRASSGPSFSLSAFAAIHSGSARKAPHFSSCSAIDSHSMM